ncbi:hypothetical protein KKG83_04145 [Candidatus Micrarchaeota archaeon]|nr:hypothetical protein [Candidatus Micrarchaeota archaeon]MBU2476636.1 hypothetical protein [Candidatus Micrarchaeota archaeon]
MDNKHRAVLFFGVMFFVLIVTIFWTSNNAQGTATKVLKTQEDQINRAKGCADLCDQLIISGQVDCEWIECHQRCYADSGSYPYCQSNE